MLTSPAADEMGTMGPTCAEKSRRLASCYKLVAGETGAHFLDAAGCEFNSIDYMHLTARGHRQLAQRLLEFLPGIL